MKSLTHISFISLLVLKIIFMSLFVFRTESNNLFLGANAIASDNKVATIVSNTRPEIADIDQNNNVVLLLKEKAELKAQREELAAIRDDINKKIEKLVRIREEIKLDLARKEAVDGQKIKHLIKAYSAMKPQSAAELIGKLSDDFAVELLSQMKGEAVGTILSHLDKDKAAKITERLAGK